MKRNILFFSLGLFFLSSCEKHDLFEDLADIGNMPPTVSWTLESTSLTAGNEGAFKAQYYHSEKDRKIDRSEIWYDIVETISLQASCPHLVSTTYSLSIETTTLSRISQCIKTFEHREDLWNDNARAYQLESTFPTSNTLRSITWKEVTDFDESKFSLWFPEDFAARFKKGVYDRLTVADFRKLFIGLGIMDEEVDFNPCIGTRLNENTGKTEEYVKEEFVGFFKSKYDGIPFEDMINDYANNLYRIEYEKSYTLNVLFKVVDDYNTVGYTDTKKITLQ